jgi:hypothetical protein
MVKGDEGEQVHGWQEFNYLWRPAADLVNLEPEETSFWHTNQETSTTKVAIHTNLFTDLYK